jgi:hypothetical protein
VIAEKPGLHGFQQTAILKFSFDRLLGYQLINMVQSGQEDGGYLPEVKCD